MSRKIIAYLFCFLTIFFIYSSVYAQMLPSADLLSPGMAKWIQTVKNAETVRFDVNASVNDLFHIRDLSVLNSILSFIRIECKSGYLDDYETTNLCVFAEEELISKVNYSLREDILTFSLDENGYSIKLSELDIPSIVRLQNDSIDRISSLLIAESWIERLNMNRVSEMLQSKELFEQITGLKFSRMQVNETFSDDGVRLTRLNIEGEIAADNESWTVKGSIFKPGGDAPKDTAEFNIIKDENNYLSVAMSSKYSIEKGKKDRNGAVTNNCRISINGKLGGYDIDYIFGLKIRNDWNADGSKLTEKLTITPSLNWTDKTSGLKLRHLNSGSVTVKNVIRITSEDESDIVTVGTDDMSIEIKMDGERVLSGTLGIYFSAENGSELILPKGNTISKEALGRLLGTYVEQISRKIYHHIGPNTQKRIVQGL